MDIRRNTNQSTVRSDTEERVAEEHPAWKHKNVPAWTKNDMFCEIHPID